MVGVLVSFIRYPYMRKITSYKNKVTGLKNPQWSLPLSSSGAFSDKAYFIVVVIMPGALLQVILENSDKERFILL
jgi:hypothetical protein